MKTVPQRQDYPALARRNYAPTPTPAPANPSRPRGLTPAAIAPCYTPGCRLPSSQRRRPETGFGQA